MDPELRDAPDPATLPPHPGLEPKPIASGSLNPFRGPVPRTFFVPQDLEREASRESETGMALGRGSDGRAGLHGAWFSCTGLTSVVLGPACLQIFRLGDSARFSFQQSGLFVVKREIMNHVIIFILFYF